MQKSSYKLYIIFSQMVGPIPDIMLLTKTAFNFKRMSITSAIKHYILNARNMHHEYNINSHMLIIWFTRDITPSQQGLRVKKDFWYNSSAPDIAQTYCFILVVRPQVAHTD
jgi:hypothetical protein